MRLEALKGRLESWLKTVFAWCRSRPAYPLVLWASTRAGYVGFSYIGMKLVPFLYMHEAGRQQYMRQFPALDGLCRWDCGWFVLLAQNGYANAEYAKVFPLFPLMGWAIEKATGLHHILAFLLISNLAALASYYVIYAIFRELTDECSSQWGLALFAAYPFAFFQAAAYPESLMVLCTAYSLYLAKKRRHLWAGTVLGLGVMARHITLAGGGALLVAQLKQRGFGRRFFLHPGFLGLGIPFAFVAAFAWYLGTHVGDPLAFWNARSIGWGPAVWFSVRQVFQNVPYEVRPEYYFYMVFALIPLAGTILLLRERKYDELSGYAVCLLWVVIGSGGVALGRYSAPCWPAFLPLGIWLAKRPMLQAPLLSMLVLFQGVFFYLFTHQAAIL